MEDIKNICANLKAFKELRDYLQADMAARAFSVTPEEYTVLKIKHQYLSELNTFIENTNYEENE